MEKVLKGGIDVIRRMAPARVAIGLLYRELEEAKDKPVVTLNKELFESVIITLELMDQDLRARFAAGDAAPRKVVDGQARIAAPRA